jgi:hypothetical protein
MELLPGPFLAKFFLSWHHYTTKAEARFVDLAWCHEFYSKARRRGQLGAVTETSLDGVGVLISRLLPIPIGAGWASALAERYDLIALARRGSTPVAIWLETSHADADIYGTQE